MPAPVTQLSTNTATNLLDRELANFFLKLANLDPAGIVCSPERSSGNVQRERCGAASAMIDATKWALAATPSRSLWNNKAVQTVANTVTETTLLDPTGNGNLTVPAYNLPLGAVFEVELFGLFSTFTSGTLTLKLKAGAAGATQVMATAAITPQASQTNQPWYIKFMVQVLTSGASGFLVGSGRVALESPTRNLASINTAATGTAMDLSVTNILDVSATWSVANAANSISVLNGYIKRIR
jgi:hypothetical protein